MDSLGQIAITYYTTTIYLSITDFILDTLIVMCYTLCSMLELIKQLVSLQRHIERTVCYWQHISYPQHIAEHIADLTTRQDNIIDQLHRHYHKSDKNIKYEVSRIS